MIEFNNLFSALEENFRITMAKSHESDTLFKSRRYKVLMDKLIHQHKKIPKEKREVIHQVIHDCMLVYKALMPLYQFNIHFTLSLAGGSVREILLDKYRSIKDLDLILSITKMSYPTIKQMQESWGFNAFEYYWLAPNNHQRRNNMVMSDKEKTYLIIRHLLSKALHITEDYAPRMDNGTQPEYLMRDLNGVIKIHSPEQNFPVDLLITTNTVNDFLNKFDFNICKAAIRLVDERETRLNILRFPENAEAFLKNYQPNIAFLYDVAKKKLSMDMDNRSVGDINRSIETHLPRIIAKYPDFVVNFMLNEQYAVNPTEKQSIIMRYQLDKALEKEKKIATKPRKI